jgi:hypothetical protein
MVMVTRMNFTKLKVDLIFWRYFDTVIVKRINLDGKYAIFIVDLYNSQIYQLI